jgi:predicted MFS family arabinose efflux permease
MFGIALAAMASGWLGERHGWQAVFYALTGLYLVIAALLWFELRTNPATTQQAAGGQPLGGSFLRMAALTRDPWVRVMLATVFLEGALLYGPLAFVAYDAHRRFGLSLGESGALLSVFPLGGLCFALASGRLLPWIGERGVVLGGGLFAGAGFIGLALASKAAIALPSILAVGIGLYMLHNTLQVHATQMAPGARGAAVALFACFLFTGQSTGVWLASHAVDGIGTLPAYLVSAAGLPLLAFWFRRRLKTHRLR